MYYKLPIGLYDNILFVLVFEKQIQINYYHMNQLELAIDLGVKCFIRSKIRFDTRDAEIVLYMFKRERMHIHTMRLCKYLRFYTIQYIIYGIAFLHLS